MQRTVHDRRRGRACAVLGAGERRPGAGARTDLLSIRAGAGDISAAMVGTDVDRGADEGRAAERGRLTARGAARRERGPGAVRGTDDGTAHTELARARSEERRVG